MTALVLGVVLPLSTACSSSSDPSPAREDPGRDKPPPGGQKDPVPSPEPNKDPSCDPASKITCNVHASPEGQDENPGTSARPVRTLKKALTIAKSGQTVSLAAGRYSEASGESWPQKVPDGVILEGSGDAVLSSGSLEKAGLLYAGAGQIRNLAFESFRYAVVAKGKLVIKNAKVTGGGGFVFGADSQGELEDITMEELSFAGVTGIEQARIRMNKGSFRGKTSPSLDAEGCKNVIGVLLGGRSNATLDNVSFTNLGNGSFAAFDDSTASIGRGTFTRPALGDACTASSQIVSSDRASVNVEDTTVSDEAGAGLFVARASSKLTFRRSSVKNSTFGAMSYGRLEVEKGTFESIGKVGIYLASDSEATIAETTISAKRFGIQADSDTKLVVRKSHMTSEDEDAVLLRDVAADLGRPDDPGGNRLLGKETGLYVLDPAGRRTLVQAAGNIWRASIQGADADGRYPTQLVDGAQRGENFVLSGGASIQF
ncbi:right-handed parallel beta-helix repeat-containing protein [Pendulispora albinea]|uniref:DUF1565 domain-containing protein n=1 Tax=Pendulispora albinea TaxID=2741071 RepID=A0ABZ2LXB4_9BACT